MAEAPPVDHTPLVDALESHYQGRLKALEGEVVEAEGLLREAVDRFAAIKMDAQRAHSCFRLGELLASTGRPGAAAALASARSLFEQLGATAWVERVDAVRAPVAA